MLFGAKRKSTPVSAGFSSSLLTANSVLSIMFFTVFAGKERFFVVSVSGDAGNSSGGFPIKLYTPISVCISILFLSSALIVILVSASSLVISNNCFNGVATEPSFSMLTEISNSTVNSRSVARSVVLSLEDSISTQLKIGSVERVGDTLESFWRACCSSVLDVENFMIHPF